MDNNDWIKEGFKGAFGLQDEAEAFDNARKEEGEAILITSGFFAGDGIERLSKVILENGLAETFSRFIDGISMGFFSEGYKAGREAQP